MRALILVYGFACYALFLLVFLYLIGFVGDLPLPTTVDRPSPAAATDTLAWIVDLVLLGLFAVQHSGMARRGFKTWLTRRLPAAAERSTYVLATSLVLILLYWQWRPIEGTVWNATAGWAVGLLWILCALGWLLVLTGTFVIDHFDLAGLRQVWLQARGRAYTPLAFKDRLYYHLIRHPLMLGFIVAFWATPRMSVGHLLFAAATTGYILLALPLEERDLVAAHGEHYRDYRRRVPMLCPWPRPRGATPSRPGQRRTTV